MCMSPPAGSDGVEKDQGHLCWATRAVLLDILFSDSIVLGISIPVSMIQTLAIDPSPPCDSDLFVAFSSQVTPWTCLLQLLPQKQKNDLHSRIWCAFLITVPCSAHMVGLKILHFLAFVPSLFFSASFDFVLYKLSYSQMTENGAINYFCKD